MYLLTDFSLPLNKDENEWITNWLTSEAYKIIALLLTTLQIIIMTALFVLHSYRLRKGTNSSIWDRKTPLGRRYIVIDVISLASIAFSLMSGLITIANYSSIFHYSTCRALTVTQNIFWLFIKVSIYIVVLLRLQVIFWRSAFELNKTFRRVCYILIISFTAILSIGTALPHPLGVNAVPLDGTDFCLLIIPPWLILTPMIFDICCCLSSMYLFICPIRTIMNHLHGDSPHEEQQFSNLLTKYILVSTLAISSNLFSSIWFAVTDILIFNYLDAFLNPICLILMQLHHKDIYLFLCKHCHRLLSKIMGFPQHQNDRKNITLHIKKTHTSKSKINPTVSTTDIAGASTTSPSLEPDVHKLDDPSTKQMDTKHNEINSTVNMGVEEVHSDSNILSVSSNCDTNN